MSLVPLLQGRSALPVTSAGAADNVYGGARMLYAHEPHYGNQGGEPASHVLRGNMKLVAIFATQMHSICIHHWKVAKLLTMVDDMQSAINRLGREDTLLN